MKRKIQQIIILILFLLAALVFSGCALLPLLAPLAGGDPDSLADGRGTAAGGSATAQPASGSAVAIQDLRTCREPKDKTCPANEDTFAPEDPRISATATITNVTAGMPAQIIWRYLGGEVDPFVVATSTVTAEQAEANRPLVSTIEGKAPDALWAKGKYVVEIKIQAGGEQTSWKEFRVK